MELSRLQIDLYTDALPARCVPTFASKLSQRFVGRMTVNCPIK